MCSSSNLTSIDLSNYTSGLPDGHQPNEWIYYQLMLPCLILFGLLNNASFIWNVIRIQSLHKSSYAYLVNLAVSDICTLTTVGVSQIVYYSTGSLTTQTMPWGFLSKAAPYLSIVSAVSSGFFYLSSIGFVSLVSVEKFLAVCHPIRLHLIKGTKRTIKLICGVWVFSCIALWPAEFYKVSKVCVIWPNTSAYIGLPSELTRIDLAGFALDPVNVITVNICNAALYLMLMSTTGYMYIRIYCTLNRRKHDMMGQSSADLGEQLRQIAFMLIVNGTAFYLICSVQMTAQLMLSFTFYFTNLNLHRAVFTYFQIIAPLAIAINASINPVIYIVTNRSYRDAVIQACRKCIGRKKKPPHSYDVQMYNTIPPNTSEPASEQSHVI